MVSIQQIPDEAYFSLKQYNNSFFKTVASKSLGHAKYEKDNPKIPTASMEFGTLMHLALLQPSEFNKNAFIVPEGNKNSKDWKEKVQKSLNMPNPPSNVAEVDAILQRQGKIKIEPELKRSILEVAHKISLSNSWQAVAKGATFESTILFECPDTGLDLKAKLDVLNTNIRIILDVKSTKDASARKFKKDAWNYGYLMQAAHYRQAAEQLTGEPFEYWILAIENSAPYAFTFYRVPAYDIDAAYEDLLKVKQSVLNAENIGQWPYYPEIQTLEVKF